MCVCVYGVKEERKKGSDMWSEVRKDGRKEGRADRGVKGCFLPISGEIWPCPSKICIYAHIDIHI